MRQTGDDGDGGDDDDDDQEKKNKKKVNGGEGRRETKCSLLGTNLTRWPVELRNSQSKEDILPLGRAAAGLCAEILASVTHN